MRRSSHLNTYKSTGYKCLLPVYRQESDAWRRRFYIDSPRRMHSSPFELVSFKRPPVQEVAFAVQFPEPSITIDFLAALPDALSFDLPVRQLRDPLPRIVEPLDERAEIQFAIRPGSTLPRAWFLSEDGVILVQAQEDRIALNWRRSGQPIDYPRYGALRTQFKELIDTTATLLGMPEGLPADFTELTYVNELDVDGGPSLPAERALTTISVPDADFLPQPEDSKWAARWLIPGDQGPRGRLIASAEPATRQDDQHDTYLLTMTVKIPETVTGTDAILERVDLGHEWIVRGFADLTTKQMHDQWGRTK